MSIHGILNSAGTNVGKISGGMLAVDVGPNMSKSYTVNGSILLDAIIPPPVAVSTLEEVLTAGNDASGQDVLGVKDLTVTGVLNCSSYNPPLPVPALADVLVSGNDALNADVVGIDQLTCYQLNYTVLNPAVPIDTLSAVLTAGNNGGGLSMQNLENIDLNGALTFSDNPSNSINVGLLKDTTTTTNTNSVNIGNHVTTAQSLQGANCVAIGTDSGKINQGANSVCVGPYAGLQGCGANSVAIGAAASQNTFTNNSIVINATGAGLNPSFASACYVAPVRRVQNNTATCNLVYQDSATGELSANSDAFVINGTGVLATSAGAGAGQWINVKVNGVSYKIELRNV